MIDDETDYEFTDTSSSGSDEESEMTDQQIPTLEKQKYDGRVIAHTDGNHSETMDDDIQSAHHNWRQLFTQQKLFRATQARKTISSSLAKKNNENEKIQVGAKSTKDDLYSKEKRDLVQLIRQLNDFAVDVRATQQQFDEQKVQPEEAEKLSGEGIEEEEEESVSWSEWLQSNIEIRQLNQEMEQLDELERFVKSKEQDLLRRIVSISSPMVADRLFPEQDKYASGSNNADDAYTGEEDELQTTRRYDTTYTSHLNRAAELLLKGALRLLRLNTSIDSMGIEWSSSRSDNVARTSCHNTCNQRDAVSISVIHLEDDCYGSDSSASDEEDLFYSRHPLKDVQNNLLIPCPTSATNSVANTTSDRDTFLKKSKRDSRVPVKQKSNEGETSSIQPLVITQTIEPVDRQVFNKQGKLVYRTDQFLDKYHEGHHFYAHLPDISIGSELPDGGVSEAIRIIEDETNEDTMHSIYGVEMSRASWLHFKNFVRKLVFADSEKDQNSDAWISDLYDTRSGSEQIDESQKPRKDTLPWYHSETEKNQVTHKKPSLEAQVKVYKLLYGVIGYAETLLSDSFPPLYTLSSSKDLYIPDGKNEKARDSLDNLIREIELMIVKARTAKDREWLSKLIKYFQDNYHEIYTSARSDIPSLSFDESHWNDLYELSEDIGQYFERYGPIHKRVVPSQTNETDSVAGSRLENHYRNFTFPKQLESWQRVLSQESDYTTSPIVEEINSIKQSDLTGDIRSAKHIVDITRVDSTWTGNTLGDLPVPISSNFKTDVSIPKHSQPYDVNHIDWGNATMLTYNPYPQKDHSRSDTSVARRFSQFYDYVVLQSHLATKKALLSAKNLTTSLMFSNISQSKGKLSASMLSESISDPQQRFKLLRRLYHQLSVASSNSEQVVPLNSIPSIDDQSYEIPSAMAHKTPDNSFQLNQSEWPAASLAEFSLGTDPKLIMEDISQSAHKVVLEVLKQHGFPVPNTPNLSESWIDENTELTNDPSGANDQEISIHEPSFLFPRANEIRKEREKKLELDSLKKEYARFEADIQNRNLKSEVVLETEKKQLQDMKEKINAQEEQLGKVIFEISPLEQAKLESWGIFDQYYNSLQHNNGRRERMTHQDDIQDDFEKQYELERELRQLDQLLDQMNRDTRKQLLSGKSGSGVPQLTKEQREAIRNYSQLRNYYQQQVRRDSSLKEWQSMSLSEKIQVEKEYYRSKSGGQPLRTVEASDQIGSSLIVGGILDRLQSAQFAETLIHIAGQMNSDSDQERKAKQQIWDNLQLEKHRIQQVTMDFIFSHNLYSRARASQQKLFSQLSSEEKMLREKFNFKNHSESIDLKPMRKPQVAKDATLAQQFEFPSSSTLALLMNELTDDELIELCQMQVTVQNEYKTSRFTYAQRILYKRLYVREFQKKMDEWTKNAEQKTRLTPSPRMLNKLEPNKENNSESDSFLGRFSMLPNMTTDEWMLYIKGERETTSNSDDAIVRINDTLFPEVSWSGKDYSVLQMVYLREQLKRSHLPQYTIYAANFNDEEQFLTRSFWRGAWMLPEGLSNFVQVREPPKPIVRELEAPPPPPPKQEKPKPPPPPQRVPVITPIIQPTAPVQPIQPVPPPMPPTLPPIRTPPLPPIRVPVAPPPPPPRTPPLQPPAPPQRIPGRDRVVLPDSTYQQAIFQDIQRRLFGGQ